MDDTLENPFFVLSPLSRVQLRKVDLLGGGGKSEVLQKGSGSSGAEGNAEDNRAVGETGPSLVPGPHCPEQRQQRQHRH